TGWSTTCGSKSEVPTTGPGYAQSVPIVGDIGAGMSALPASLFIPSKPSWFCSTPWPAMGADVSSGNVGQCSGTQNPPGEYAGVPATSSAQCVAPSLASAWGGHVNAIPAMNCFLNVMGGVPDGS